MGCPSFAVRGRRTPLASTRYLCRRICCRASLHAGAASVGWQALKEPVGIRSGLLETGDGVRGRVGQTNKPPVARSG